MRLNCLLFLCQFALNMIGPRAFCGENNEPWMERDAERFWSGIPGNAVLMTWPGIAPRPLYL